MGATSEVGNGLLALNPREGPRSSPGSLSVAAEGSTSEVRDGPGLLALRTLASGAEEASGNSPLGQMLLIAMYIVIDEIVAKYATLVSEMNKK